MAAQCILTPGKAANFDLPTSFVFLEDQTIKTQSHPTRDAAALARYLDSNRPGFRALRTSTNGWGEVRREEISLKALDYLAFEAAKRPGRKILIWISPGGTPGTIRTRVGSESRKGAFSPESSQSGINCGKRKCAGYDRPNRRPCLRLQLPAFPRRLRSRMRSTVTCCSALAAQSRTAQMLLATAIFRPDRSARLRAASLTMSDLRISSGLELRQFPIQVN